MDKQLEPMKRIAVNVPASLKEALLGFILPGFLNKAIRNMLLSLTELRDERGAKTVMLAIINDNLKVIIEKSGENNED